MSVHRRGQRWEVRWREGSRNRSKMFDRKRDADDFNAEVRRRRRLGQLGMWDAGQQTLAEFAREWWTRHADRTLAENTKEAYASAFDKHVLPRLGGFQLRELTGEIVDQFRNDLERADVGKAAVRKALAVLSSMLARAVVWGRIPSNPVAGVSKPSQRRERAVKPLTPDVIEAVRHRLLTEGMVGDATLVSVLAYAGLRPGEALALTWGDVRDRTILVEKAVARGQVKTTKTNAIRTVRLLTPLASDLAEWKLRSGRPDDRALIFPSGRGNVWTDGNYRSWRHAVFTPAVEAVTGDSARVYDLRHSFVSLLIAEGRSVTDVARQAGHSAVLCLQTYAHVFDEWEEAATRQAAEERIRAARSSVRVPFAAGGGPTTP